MEKAHFCTCPDEGCPFNPRNHEKGCDLCIQKCLRQGEIPSCFFMAVSDAMDTEDYTYGGFVRYYEAHSNEGQP